MEQILRNYSDYGESDHQNDISMESIILQIREKDMIIEQLRKENDSLKSKMKDIGKNNTKKTPQSRYWSKDEHDRFLEALEKFGKKDVKSISVYVGTRSPTQVRTHSQKYFLKMVSKNKRDSGKKKGTRKGRKSSYNDSDDSDDIIDDTSQGYDSYYQKEMRISTPKKQGISKFNNQVPDTKLDSQALLEGIRKYDNEHNMKKKIELIHKDFLPHKSVEEIAQMMSTHPILFNPEATDPNSRYYYLPQSYMIPQYPNQAPYQRNGQVPFDMNNGMNTMQQINKLASITQNDKATSISNPIEKDDEELENELQNLQNTSKTSSGLSGFIGHSVVLSPTVFHGTPLVFGSPLMSHTPVLGESLTPQFGFSMGKTATSPLFFVGADHQK